MVGNGALDCVGAVAELHLEPVNLPVAGNGVFAGDAADGNLADGAVLAHGLVEATFDLEVAEVELFGRGTLDARRTLRAGGALGARRRALGFVHGRGGLFLCGDAAGGFRGESLGAYFDSAGNRVRNNRGGGRREHVAVCVRDGPVGVLVDDGENVQVEAENEGRAVQAVDGAGLHVVCADLGAVEGRNHESGLGRGNQVFRVAGEKPAGDRSCGFFARLLYRSGRVVVGAVPSDHQGAGKQQYFEKWKFHFNLMFLPKYSRP